jgi:hypothetical protein
MVGGRVGEKGGSAMYVFIFMLFICGLKTKNILISVF